MGTVNISNSFEAGTIMDADEMNTNFTDIETFLNGENITNANIVETVAAIVGTKIDDYSNTAGEMQTETDPYPLGVLDKPITLAGELERIRFKINQLNGGNAYWYENKNIPVMTTQATRDTNFLSYPFYTDLTELTAIDLPNVTTDATDSTYSISFTLTCRCSADAGGNSKGVYLALFEGADGDKGDTKVIELRNSNPVESGYFNWTLSNYIFTPAAAANKKVGLAGANITGSNNWSVYGSDDSMLSFMSIQKIK